MVLVNARLSEKSLRQALRTPNLVKEAARNFALVLAQTDADAQRMRQVGAERIEVVGNLKFDFTPPADLVERGKQWRASLGPRPVLLFASTREGEEPLLLDALQSVVGRARVFVVPRHPQRFEEVAGLLASRGLRFARRSEMADGALPLPSDVDVLLGDSMAEMAMYYAAADVALIGGSLLELGGQNLIEACAIGTPVVVGPHTFNFAQATADAIEAGAAVRVETAGEAIAQMLAIAERGDERRRHALCRAAPGRHAADPRTDYAVRFCGAGAAVFVFFALAFFADFLVGLAGAVSACASAGVAAAGTAAGAAATGGVVREPRGGGGGATGTVGTSMGCAGSSSAFTAVRSSSVRVPVAAFS
jgi:3-deoxy-D-manno-octulosonic-acid transferase